MAKTKEEIILKLDVEGNISEKIKKITTEFERLDKKSGQVIKETNTEFKKLDTTTGKWNRTGEKTVTTFKNIKKGVGGANNSFKLLNSTLKRIATSFLIYRTIGLVNDALRGSVSILAEFELSMNKVKAITGATDEEFQKLNESAKQLALGTKFTATQVSELQLAYAKLGFTTGEILDAADATLKLATITGDDLAGAADVVGATIRGFGLDASETARVVDVMAKSFTESGLTLEHFKQSMKTLAPVASSANIDLEETTALLGVLADRGLRGTLASTGLKNIMAELVDPTSELAKHLGYTINNSEGLMTAFGDLGEEGIDLAIAAGLIDKRARPAFVTLANGVKDVEDLREKLDEATGSANDMAEVIEDSLTIQWQKFVSAVQGYVLNEGEQTLEWMKDFVESITLFINRRNEEFMRLQGVMKLQEEQFLGLADAQAPYIALLETQSALNSVIEKQEKELLETKQKALLATGDTAAALDKEIKEEERSLAINRERKKRIDEEVESRKKLIEGTETQISQIKKEIYIGEKYRNFLMKKGGRASEVKLINEEIERLRELLKLKGIEAESPTTDLPTGPTVDFGVDLDTNFNKALEAAKGNVKKTTKELVKKIDETFEENHIDGAWAQWLGVTDRQLQEAMIGIDAAMSMIDEFNSAFVAIQENRLNAIISANEQDMQSFIDMQDEKLRKEQIYQDEESALFIGSQEEKAIFERQQKLEMLEFEKRQQDERDKLREKQLKKENEIAQKIFKVDKANSIAQVAIQTALGIAQINANPIVNSDLSQGLRIALTSMLTATGAAQTAAILSQKYQPKTFQDGGMIVGPSHSDGGVPFTVGGQGGFEAEGGEFIMSRKSVDRLGAGFLNALNSGQTMFREGGSVPSSVISGASAPMNNFMASLDARFAQLENIMSNIKVTNVAVDTIGVSSNVQNAQSQATF